MPRTIFWGRWTLFGVLFFSQVASAASESVHLLPTQVRVQGAPISLAATARELDELLSEAVLDFDLVPVAEAAQLPSRHAVALRERELVQLAENSWVVAPQLMLGEGGLWLRLVAIAPGSETLWIRSDFIGGGQLAVRTLGLLRELLANRGRSSAGERSVRQSGPVLAHTEKRSAGKAVLALHAAALGGYLGVALQRASGSTDLRLAYPLATLGAGVGLASAMVVAEEWDITPAAAWYLGASAVWPTVGTLLLIQGQSGSPREDRHLFGLLSAAGGLTLATAGLSQGEVSYGGATLTHSGALFGMLLGGLTQRVVAGDAAGPLTTGMGVGAIVGLAASGAVASQWEVPSASDLLLVDLSAVLGGLAAAALGTPFLISEETSKVRDRVWLGGVMLGTIAGGAVGYAAVKKGARAPDSVAESELQFSRSKLTGSQVSGSQVSGSHLEVRPTLGAVGEAGWGLGLVGAW